MFLQSLTTLRLSNLKGQNILNLAVIDLSNLTKEEQEEFEVYLPNEEDDKFQKRNKLSVLTILNTSFISELSEKKEDCTVLDTKNIQEKEKSIFSLIFPRLEDFTVLSDFDIKISYFAKEKN